MSDRQVKKYSARLYFLEYPAIFGNRTSKNLGVLVRWTNELFKIFLPLCNDVGAFHVHGLHIAYTRTVLLSHLFVFLV